MKELRSVVNAVFCFLVFLLIYAFTVPGHAHGSSAPRFLRMEISDVGQETVHPARFSFSVPFGLVRHGLRAAGGRVRQELECRFDQSIEAEQVRSLWKELSEKPDGTVVTRTFDEDKWSVVKDGVSIRIIVGHSGLEEVSDDTATITIPAAFLSRLADRDKALDVDALLGELAASQAGSLLEVQSHDGKVKVWID
jgi:hypothetical protein